MRTGVEIPGIEDPCFSAAGFDVGPLAADDGSGGVNRG